MSTPKSTGAGDGLDRRGFLKAGSAAAMTVTAGAVISGCAHSPSGPAPAVDPSPRPKKEADVQSEETKPKVRRYRALGRTGFSVSDIAMGCGRIGDPNLVRYACDRGVNLLDTAEGYGNGDSERSIGAAMKHLTREKLFIITKLKIDKGEPEQRIRERFSRCLERMKTAYADALYMHSVTDLSMIKHPGFHEAVRKLKADGKVKHAGISSHGPRDKGGDSMERVLLAAAEDGRFDVMLLVYNFLNSAGGERVLASCKERRIGTTLMKTAPGRLKLEPFEPKNPSEEHARVIRLLIGRGNTREQAVAKIQERLAYQRQQLAKNQPALDAFVKQHGVKTQDDLARKSVQWALSNEDVNTVCVSMPDFERIDDFVPLSGTKLARDGQTLLNDFAAAFGDQYCRHGCSACLDRCPYGVPVATVMRYAYYFQCQGREKHAMKKYAKLGGVDGSRCLDCEGPCRRACPHGVAIQAQLLAADHLLSLA